MLPYVTICYYMLLYVTICYYMLLYVTVCYCMLLHVNACYCMLRYTAYQLMVDTVLRLQFRCDENNAKFQQHINVSVPSSHRNMKATFPELLSPKRGQILSWGQKHNKPKSRR